jgi:kynurenine formamidase
MAHRDLTRRVETGMQTYPGDPPVSVAPHATVEADGYRISAVECGTHAGTHVDAPSHTEPDGRTIDEFPVGTFAFDARLVDLRGRDPRAAIRPEDLPETDAGMLVLRTGWAERWGEPSYFDHPYLSRAAAEYCAERGCHVATDAASVDLSPVDAGTAETAGVDEPDGIQAHRALLGAERLIIENLRSLGGLPDRFELRAYPMRVAGGDGAPVRAVAVTERR